MLMFLYSLSNAIIIIIIIISIRVYWNVWSPYKAKKVNSVTENLSEEL